MPTKKPSRTTRARKTTRAKVASSPSNVVSIIDHLDAKGLTDSIACRRFRMMLAIAAFTGFDLARAEFDVTAASNMPDFLSA